MKKIIVLILVLCTSSLITVTYAQDGGVQGKVKSEETAPQTMDTEKPKLLSKATDRYRSAIGARIVGDPIGLSYKQFLGKSNNALEFILGFDVFSGNGFALTGLYETHIDPFNSNTFQLYYGYGGHIGSNKGLRLGVDAVGGLDFYFKIKDVPLNLSFDVKPSLAWAGEDKFQFILGGGF